MREDGANGAQGDKTLADRADGVSAGLIIRGFLRRSKMISTFACTCGLLTVGRVVIVLKNLLRFSRMTDQQLALARASGSRRLTRGAIVGLLAFGTVLMLLITVSAVSLGCIAWLICEGYWALVPLWAGAAWSWGRLSWACAGCFFCASALPDGIRLSRRSGASMYRLADEVGRLFGGVRVDTIWITPEMNAAVLQRPRWGLLGRMQTHLLIGLPLAHSVSELQLRAILAHEYAHLHFQRRGAAAWAGHVRAWWARVVEASLERLPLIGYWLDRHTQRHFIDARDLARLEEFEADRHAGRVSGQRLLAETLVDVAVKEAFLVHDYWAKVMSQARWRAAPVIRPYRELRLGMQAGFGAWHGRRDCLQGLLSDAGADETLLHPSVAERVQALGQRPGLLPFFSVSAAERHLAAMLPMLAWAFDYNWWLSCREAWQQTYRDERAFA